MGEPARRAVGTKAESERNARARRIASGLAVAFAVALVVAVRALAIRADFATQRDLHRVDYVGSASCTRCHPSHAASFARTFHRTMTRDAARDTVLAPFAGETLTYGGFVATMRTEQGVDLEPRFVIELAKDGVVVDRAIVARTVGSHRDQQYLARVDDRWIRVPLAWDVEESRWMHLNEAFLTPDPLGLDDDAVSREDYARHATVWNDNCVFCHNVGPVPGLDERTGRFETRVAELGVACEACHGPGGEHVRANVDPFRRYTLHGGGLLDVPDPTIVHPARLSSERASEICGRCHGQRITSNVLLFLRDGDPFVPGDELGRYSTPLSRETTLNGERGVFAERFWDDGTARLTAYEYQGLLQSRCASEGGLGCGHCHAMHEGDPRGQIRPSVAGDRMCTQCHSTFATLAASWAHVAEAGLASFRLEPAAGPDHASVRCVDCHMPRVVYGLRDAHRSHRIDSPRPNASDRLDACSLCHLDRRWSPERAPGLEDLFAGDPIQRAIVAAALGRSETVAPSRAERIALLLEVARDDDYPGVRSVASSSLRRLTGLALPWLPTDPRPVRVPRIEALAARLGAQVAPKSERAALRARASNRAIEIGE